MAINHIRANRAHVTAPPTNWPAGIATGAFFLPAQQLFAVLGHEGAGDLIEALLTAMDAADGDTDREGTIGDGLTDDEEPDSDGGDWSWPESHGKGLIGRIEPLAQNEDSEDDDPAGGNVEDRGDDDRFDHSFGDTVGAAPEHRDRIRRTRCRVSVDTRYYIGHGYMGGRIEPVGWELKREPVVPRELRRLKRRENRPSNVVAFRRGAK